VREVGAGLRSRRRRRKIELPSHMTKGDSSKILLGARMEVVTDAKGNYLLHPTLHYTEFPEGSGRKEIGPMVVFEKHWKAHPNLKIRASSWDICSQYHVVMIQSYRYP
jgi:hypothetical protein